jgi:hypothetical protein
MRNTLVFISLLLFFSCGKDSDSFSGNVVISGTAFYKNLFAADSTGLIPYASGEVFVRKTTDDRDAYFTKVTTDKDGKFYLTLSNRNVVLYIKPAIPAEGNTSIPLYGDFTPSNDNTTAIKLVAGFDPGKQNGFMLQLRDEGGGIVAGASAHLYSSEIIATLDNSSAAITVMTSNPSGMIYKTNLPAGTYYINASRRIDTVHLQRMLRRITVAATGLIQDTMILRKTNGSNGFVLTLKDSTGGSITGAQLYLFNSQLAALSNQSSQAIETLLSDNSGKVSKMNLASGTYYVNAEKTINGVTFQRTARVLNVLNNIIIDTLLLAPQFINSLVVTVKDSLGGNIPGAEVYLYTSAVLAASNDPGAAIERGTTDNSGQFRKDNLPPDIYYVNARKTAGNIIYERLAKRMVIPDFGSSRDTLILRRQQ